MRHQQQLQKERSELNSEKRLELILENQMNADLTPSSSNDVLDGEEGVEKFIFLLICLGLNI